MKVIRCATKFIELSRWFNRKSQHYILGNWAEYTPLLWNFKKKAAYYKRYPIAYVKFMWYSRHDICE